MLERILSKLEKYVLVNTVFFQDENAFSVPAFPFPILQYEILNIAKMNLTATAENGRARIELKGTISNGGRRKRNSLPKLSN